MRGGVGCIYIRVKVSHDCFVLSLYNMRRAPWVDQWHNLLPHFLHLSPARLWSPNSRTTLHVR